MSSNLLLLMISSGMRSIIFSVAVVIRTTCASIRGAVRFQIRVPQGGSPGLNFPGIWPVWRRCGIVRSVWYIPYYVNGAPEPFAGTPDADVVPRPWAPGPRGTIDALRPRATCQGHARELLVVSAHPPVQRAAPSANPWPGDRDA